MDVKNNTAHSGLKPYLSPLGAWALAFGCAVGWGAFVMPGGTFLPIAGPLGTVLGIVLGGAVTALIGLNYHYMMNCHPDAGGTFSYAKRVFGYDSGFLCAWFLLLTYVAIIWANATALPLIARKLFGGLFQIGFHYELAGFQIYGGEILLALGALGLCFLLCLRSLFARRVQIGMALLLLLGVGVCITAALLRHRGGLASLGPAFTPENRPFTEVFSIVALAPWAYVGFESISHSTQEFHFSVRKSGRVLLWAVAAAAFAYAALALLAVTMLPEGFSSWDAYIARLDDLDGIAGLPTFYAANASLGVLGLTLLGLAALGGIVTGLVGNYIAASRLIYAMSEDRLIPAWFGKLNKRGIPTNALLSLLVISAVMPFFGRTAISWIVDVTTVGAAIAYSYASAAALRTARERGERRYIVTGSAGLAISLLFVLFFLVPNMLAVKTLATESYLILAAWSILGFVVFHEIFKRDKEQRLGRTTVVWIVLLSLIIFTSTVWLNQATDAAMARAVKPIDELYTSRLAGSDAALSPEEDAQAVRELQTMLGRVGNSLTYSSLVQIGLIVAAIAVLFNVYTLMQKRERQTEIEKALAEESSRAKTSFLSNMSHEIRTPMNAIIGLDNIALRDPELSPRTREQLEKIGASARHLLALINDILDMSRIESGRMSLKEEEFSLREFLDQINVIINGQCMDKGLRYECSILGQTDDYFVGDDLKLKQVLINILGNAVKFTNAPGTVTFTVEQTARLDGNCTLRFTMKDTGIGMDKDFIPKLFDAFSQEDSTTTNRYGGSGLGMAITKSIVEMMGGEIRVESEKGVGSTFTVTISLKGVEDASHIPERDASFAGLRVLVADDDELACQHAAIVLGELGIQAETCSHSTEAYSLIRQHWDEGEPYQLIMTDYLMPVINGIALTQEIRRFDKGATPIIILTGYDFDERAEEAQRAGVDGILSKPLFADSLLREIQYVMRRRGEKQPAPPETQTPTAALDGRRVLMAEDIELNAEILTDLLDMEGIEGEWAQNGQIAVEMFEASAENYYDAILMDVRMPVMDGLGATRAIRALERPDAKRIPIIAMTANAFDEDVQRSFEAGMNAHLSKPIDPEKLYAQLARQITQQEKETL